MAEHRALTLIVARPGPLREGLEALLASVPEIEIVGGVEFASKAVSIAADHPLDLLLLDVGLPGDKAARVLASCRRQRPRLHCIALADNMAQEQRAEALGADAVFLKGYPADRFVETVEALLSDRKTSDASLT